MNKKPLFIFLTAFLCISISVTAHGCFLSNGYFINVANEINDKNIQVQVHCKSRDNHDMGMQSLAFNESVHWQFCENIVTSRTLYFCHFFMGPFSQVFDVYNSSVAPQCVEKHKHEYWRCTWLIRLDGFYFVDRKEDHEKRIKMFDWNMS